eukprot:3941046-Rhodomonas_salina.1
MSGTELWHASIAPPRCPTSVLGCDVLRDVQYWSRVSRYQTSVLSCDVPVLSAGLAVPDVREAADEADRVSGPRARGHAQDDPLPPPRRRHPPPRSIPQTLDPGPYRPYRPYRPHT